MLDAVYKAIKARWEAVDALHQVTGVVHRSRAKGSVAGPYAILSQPGPMNVVTRATAAAVAGTARTTEIMQGQFQITLYDRRGENAAIGPAAAIRDAFNGADLNIPGANAMYCRLAHEILLDDERNPGHPNAVLWAFTFDILASKDRVTIAA